MKFIFYILPFLGAIALAQDLTSDKCQCPQVKCRADDAVALCACHNSRERLCADHCTGYKPVILHCPKVSPTPVPLPSSISVTIPKPTPKPTTKPVTCDCIKFSCLQVWPGFCYCANTAAQRCYDDCGGAPPVLQDCGSTEGVVARAPEPAVVARAEVEAACVCEDVFCVQSWPESCYCGNAAKQACQKKCGGPKPSLQQCPPQSSSTLATSTKKTPKPTPTPTKPAKPTHSTCGGGRAGSLSCSPGYTCVDDPYSQGCGLACDGLGICVEDKMCGGFPGFPCQVKGQVCNDDPRDECDPKNGGADCGGLCMWPH